MTAGFEPVAPAGTVDSAISPGLFRQVEGELASLRYRQLPIAPTLNDYLVISLLWGNSDQRLRTRWLNRARMLRHRMLPQHARSVPTDVPTGRILLTWQEATPRFNQLLQPVLGTMGVERVQVLMGLNDPSHGFPEHTSVLSWHDEMRFHSANWRREYRRHAPVWQQKLEDVCRRHRLPDGTVELLALRLLIASQWIEGSLGLLKLRRPVAVVTEYDRSYRWSCLVTAARHLGIPTLTLVHGVIPPQAIGFSPVLADAIVCWGTTDRNRLVAAGEDMERIVVGGCPRLTRDLPVTAAQARHRLQLTDSPTILLATSPDRGAADLAETFCQALDSMPHVTALVRLHPAETVVDYAAVSKRHPRVRFMPSTAGTLEESLAAATVVVVRGSGVGSDALLKRRPVVVLSPDGQLRGNDADLVKQARCPLATTAEELRSALLPFLVVGTEPVTSDEVERYLADFCAAFGGESAHLIADAVDSLIERGHGVASRMP